MAEREVTLRMRPDEEAALAALVALVCEQIAEGRGPVLPAGSYQHIGSINAALNAIR